MNLNNNLNKQIIFFSNFKKPGFCNESGKDTLKSWIYCHCHERAVESKPQLIS